MFKLLKIEKKKNINLDFEETLSELEKIESRNSAINDIDRLFENR